MDKKIKILLVDDDQSVRTIYADIFGREGFEVVEAEDGVDGLDKATKVLPDVIFSGIIMPRMDGFALKETLSKSVSTANIPVLMLSHMGREEDRKKAIELGAKDFIVQGMITPKQVVEKVRAMFGSNEYRISFEPNEKDGVRLASDLKFAPGFRCKICGSSMEMVAKVSDLASRELSIRIVCPNVKDGDHQKES